METRQKTETSLKKITKIAGLMFLLAFIIPSLNWAFVLSIFNVPENSIASANNILANEVLFRIGITIELIMSIGLIVLGLALYLILKHVNKEFALLALILKLAEATTVISIIFISFAALQFLNIDSNFTGIEQNQLLFPSGVLLNAHTALYAIPMTFLGIDMMIFSYLFYKSNYIPKILAAFGILSFALIFIHAIMFLITPDFATIPLNQIIFWAPSGLFEITIGLWLLIEGIKIN
jgi:Domain of unknown function (DUF4386)